MRRARRGLLLVILAVVGAAVAVLGGASPAGAHAVVESSSPSRDERLTTAPTQVTITFSEGITSDLGGLTVLDSTGHRVDNDDSSQPTPTSVMTTLRSDLGDGTYVANYKVVSADGHPVSGAIVFGVGNAQLGDVSGLAASNDTTTERLGVVARFLTYSAALLAAGLAFFLVFIHDGGPDRRSMATVVKIATIVAAFGAVLTIAAQASLATGEGLGAMAQLDVLRGVLREGLGWSTAVLFVGLALCFVAASTRPSTLAQGLTFYGSLAITTSFVFWGHAIEAPNTWLAIGADVVHVAVAAVWFGGLVGLTMTLRIRFRTARAAGFHEPNLLVDAAPEADAVPVGAGGVDLSDSPVFDEQPSSAPDDDPDPRPEVGSLAATVAIVERFSTTAAVSVAILAASGLVLGWQELGSLAALTSTGYGQTLLVKLAIVGVVLFLAAYNRFLLLPWLLAEETEAPAPAPAGAGAETETETEGDRDATRAEIDAGLEAGWRTLLRTVGTEALAIVAVLAVTAVLVNVIPGRSEAIPSGPFTETQAFRDGTVSLTITPNQPGVNSFHVDFLGADGRPADLAQKVVLELRMPEKDVGPIEREMVKPGVGHFILEGISDLSIPGTWEITLAVRVSDFDQQRVTFTDTIG